MIRHTGFLIILVLCCWQSPGVAVAADPAKAPVPLSLEPGDRLVLLGGTFAERMGQFGYFETLLASRRARLRLTLRSLAWPADEVTRREWQFALIRYMGGRKGWADGGEVLLQPRPRDFGNVYSHLKQQKPTVLLMCFGFNESFQGKAGLVKFGVDLARFVGEMKRPLATGREAGKATGPRIVLVSPIAQERIGRFGPDPRSRNSQLKMYTGKIRSVAAASGVSFVDLFTATQRLVTAAESPRLTFNGVHLTGFGNWIVAQLMADGLGLAARPWRVSIDGRSAKATATATTVADVGVAADRVVFVTGDAVLPVPPPSSDGSPRKLTPVLAEPLPRLTVSGLAAGRWTLLINGQVSAKATADEWARGVRLTRGGSLAAAEELRSAVIEKNRQFFFRWRAVNGEYNYGRRKNPFGTKSFPSEMKKLDRMVRDRDEKIWYLARPRPAMQFELKRDVS